ncbi:actin-binding protein [Niveomyces insectorum RCEF 264]|uniref:Actin-binding protein n=1 Tax=Niveomyces insectorum RCEF 264 TaxID=1081102 RepID=A0A167QEV4_9HYPO|nr:actin-binding protein [Niveomyces insectorum RCEF 264]
MAPNHGLVHAKTYDIKDSNVELIGSDIDRRVKYASAATEPAWNNGVVGVQPGLFVWRIEDFQVVPVPSTDIGVFYDGDSYIVLHSYRLGRGGDSEGDGHAENRPLGHDIFFWLGAHTSQDEAGTAAYKTVELDAFLRDAATQHRELQASPSAAFLALFPHRLTIRRGGVATGFTHVTETVEAARAHKAVLLLLRVFQQPSRVGGGSGGSGGIVVHEVEPTPSSLDDDDVFVLDAGDTVYVWQGRHSRPREKAAAAGVAEDLRTPAHVNGVQVLAQDDGRAGTVVRLMAGEGASSSSSSSNESSYRAARPLASATPPSEPSALRSAGGLRPQRLWRLSDASGTLAFDLVKDGGGPPALADLDSNDVFLWDDAGCEVWVWEGRGASAGERAHWVSVTQAYMRHLHAGGGAGDNAHLTPVAKVREGHESPAFLRSLRTAAAY